MNKISNIILACLFAINTVNADIYLKAAIDFGHIPQGSSVEQVLTLCSNSDHIEHYAYSFSHPGFELLLLDGVPPKDNPILLNARIDQAADQCRHYIIRLNSSELDHHEDWQLSIAPVGGEGKPYSFSIAGRVLSREQWLSYYPPSKALYLYTGHFDIPLSRKQDDSNRLLTRNKKNIVFDGFGVLAVISDEGEMNSHLYCLSVDGSNSYYQSRWLLQRHNLIAEGTCGLASVPHGAQIAVTSGVNRELSLFRSCEEANNHETKVTSKNRLHKSCNVAILRSPDGGSVQLATLGQKQDYAPSVFNQVWLTLWTLNITQNTLSYSDSRLASYDSTPSFITSSDAIATTLQNQRNLIAITDLKSTDHHVAHFTVENDALVKQEDQPDRYLPYASKSMDFNHSGKFRVNVMTGKGDSIIIEQCNSEQICESHQIISAENFNTPGHFTPSHASFGTTSNRLVITDQDGFVYIMQPDENDYWKEVQRFALPGVKGFDKGIFDSRDHHLAILSEAQSSIYFFDSVLCHNLNRRFIWPDDVRPQWWRNFILSFNCPVEPMYEPRLRQEQERLQKRTGKMDINTD